MVILRSHFLNQTYDGSDSGTLPVGSFNYCFPMDIDNTKSMGFRKCHGSTQDVRVKNFLHKQGKKQGTLVSLCGTKNCMAIKRWCVIFCIPEILGEWPKKNFLTYWHFKVMVFKIRSIRPYRRGLFLVIWRRKWKEKMTLRLIYRTHTIFFYDIFYRSICVLVYWTSAQSFHSSS